MCCYTSIFESIDLLTCSVIEEVTAQEGLSVNSIGGDSVSGTAPHAVAFDLLENFHVPSYLGLDGSTVFL
jgi:hypothetical protein